MDVICRSTVAFSNGFNGSQSNSIAVTPKLTCETWFMEGTLKPDYHYIEIKADFSDIEEKLRYYAQHPDAAQQIINHAHEYIAQFQDAERERLIALVVLQRYLDITNPGTEGSI